MARALERPSLRLGESPVPPDRVWGPVKGKEPLLRGGSCPGSLEGGAEAEVGAQGRGAAGTEEEALNVVFEPET